MANTRQFRKKINRKPDRKRDQPVQETLADTIAAHEQSRLAKAEMPDHTNAKSLRHSLVLQTQQYLGNHHIQQQLSGQRVYLQVEDTLTVNYEKAKRGNQREAVRLGWSTRLVDIKPDWAALWSSDNFDRFADAVAAFQAEQGFRKKDTDGILGPNTWNRLRPIGEVIAGQKVSWDKSTYVCSIATQERLTKGYQRAIGKKLVTEEEKDTFRIILHSIESQLHKVDEAYRGTGAAGALVYLGAGELVSEADIWENKKLKPGAAMQVWRKKSDLERIKKGKKPLSIGTSFVFVKYEGADKMKVLHFDKEEVVQRGRYEVWFGANLTAR